MKFASIAFELSIYSYILNSTFSFRSAHRWGSAFTALTSAGRRLRCILDAPCCNSAM